MKDLKILKFTIVSYDNATRGGGGGCGTCGNNCGGCGGPGPGRTPQTCGGNCGGQGSCTACR